MALNSSNVNIDLHLYYIKLPLLWVYVSKDPFVDLILGDNLIFFLNLF